MAFRACLLRVWLMFVVDHSWNSRSASCTGARHRSIRIRDAVEEDAEELVVLLDTAAQP